MSVSPYHVRRVEEKTELQFLNTRLENYVLHCKNLAEERDRLAAELETIHEVHARDREQLIARHEVAIESVRSDLNLVNRELSRREMECEKHTKELDQLKDRLADYTAIKKERDRLRARITPLEEENEDLKRQLALLQGNYDEMALSMKTSNRTIADLEGRLKATEEEAASTASQLSEANARHRLEFNKFKEAAAANLRTAREEWERANAARMAKLERDLEEKYDQNIKELHARCDNLLEQNRRLQEENRKMEGDAKRHSAIVAEMNLKVQRAEEAASDATNEWARKVALLETKVSDYSSQMADKEDQFNDLMDIKISLEAEIQHYRDILDIEEKRLSVSSIDFEQTNGGGGASAATTPSKDDTGKKATKERVSRSTRTKVVTKTKTKTTPRRAAKRAMEDKEEEEEVDTPKRQRASVRTFLTKSTMKYDSGVNMTLDLKADCVTIQNHTKKLIPLKGWVLESDVGSQKFNFPEDAVLDRGAKITVWSGRDAKKHHNPPDHLFWTRKFIWNDHGDVAVLKDDKGVVVQEVEGSPVAPSDLPSEIPGDDKNCTIM